jgi:hypothetical protein
MTIDPRAGLEAVSGVRVEEVDEGALETYCDVIARGWELDRAAELSRHRALFCRPERRHRMFLGLVGGEAVAAAGLVMHPRSGYLLGAVVLPGMRGRGLYRALVGARLRATAEAGLTLATSMAREATSAPILERLGFETACRFRMFASA